MNLLFVFEAFLLKNHLKTPIKIKYNPPINKKGVPLFSLTHKHYLSTITNLTMKEKIKPIKIIHIALCLGVLVAYFLIGDLLTLDFLKVPVISSRDFIYLIFPILAIVLGNILYKRQLGNASKDLKLEDKVGVYQTALLIRWALLEGVAFFILFTKKELIIIGLILIFYMAYLKPSEEGMKRDFEILGKL